MQLARSSQPTPSFTVIDLVPNAMVERFAVELASVEVGDTAQLVARMTEHFRGLIERRTDGSLSVCERETLVTDVSQEARRRCMVLLRERIQDVEQSLSALIEGSYGHC